MKDLTPYRIERITRLQSARERRRKRELALRLDRILIMACLGLAGVSLGVVLMLWTERPKQAREYQAMRHEAVSVETATSLPMNATKLKLRWCIILGE